MRRITSLLGKWCLFFSLIVVIGLASCDDEDPPLADNLVQFESDALGLTPDEESLTVNITLSREAAVATDIAIGAELNGVTYDTEFTTDPAMQENTLTIAVPAGATQVSFVVNKKEGVFFDGDESIVFTITSPGQDLVVGERNALTVSFAEIVAAQGTMDPNVGGPQQPNKVFVDLSANRQSYVNRSDWDLGFYMAEGQFRVILNSSSSMMARALDKNNLNDVTAADTIGWGVQLSTDAVFAAVTSGPPPAWIADAIDWIDDPTGNMEGTAIAEISSNDADNKVYIINRGKNPDNSPRGWKKVRIIRNGDGYTLQHADIDATSFTTVEVTREDAHLFHYVKFETGVVPIEPEKDKWDIAFTVFTNTTPLDATTFIPYVFSDVVIQNRYNTETAELLIADTGSYEDFDDADLASVTFSTNQTNIGANWRTTGGPGMTPGLKEDRFYLVKDAAGNIYKLKFTAFTQGGERGRPQIQFALIKPGE